MMNLNALPNLGQSLPLDMNEIILPCLNLIFNILKFFKYCDEFSLVSQTLTH